MGRTLLIVVALIAIAIGGYFARMGGEKAAPVVAAPIEQMDKAKQEGMEQNLGGAAQRIEQDRALNGTYAGADLSSFPVQLIRADAGTYCIQATDGTTVEHIAGPNGSPQPGGC